MRLLLDTSIWVECHKDEGLKGTVSSIAQKHEMVTSETVGAEISKAASFLKDKGILGANELESFYSQRTGEVCSNKECEELSEEYHRVGKQVGVDVEKMDADLVIVAAATTKGADAVLTLNRKTMASDLAKLTYLLVNAKRSLKVPVFITDRAAIKKFADARA
jgi:predicted nucleic acid-binding protein